MIPGGGIEGDETPDECCVREIAEETGIVAKAIGKFLTVREYYEDCVYTSHFFVCNAVGECEKRLTDAEKREQLSSEWVDFDKLRGILSRHNDFDGVFEEKRGAYLRDFTALCEYEKLI
ncbi:MAG: NUDIX hydrolase, partial [Clostridiales bacterium]|nr:NUDIX hydrolase [Clostridiales bacterium]